MVCKTLRRSIIGNLFVWLGVLLAGCAPGHSVVQISLSDAALETMMMGIYEAGQEQFNESDPPTNILILPHHLTAAKTIAMATTTFNAKEPTSILLLSPDHFGECPTAFCFGDISFESEVGRSDPDPDMLKALRISEFVTEKPELFEKEHGITAVIPFLVHKVPEVKVTPVVASVIPQSPEKRERYLALLKTILKEGDTLIVSSDFSHYLPASQADEMDEATAKALFSKDFDAIAELKNPVQSDCPVCVWLAARYADETDAYNPGVLLHTNSARILNEDVQETTSHFAIAFYPNDQLTSDDIAFGGDFTFTRPRGNIKLSPKLSEFWSGNGPRVVNLEGPLKKECQTDPNPFIFCNLYDKWISLKDLATHWGVENNHMLDQGSGSVVETISLINEGGEEFIDTTGKQIGTMNVFALTHLLNPVTSTGWSLNEDHLAVINALNANRSSSNTQVVFIHAGTEYNALSNENEVLYYRSFIESGADIVIVAHTHVPGDMEYYQGGVIFRGLGNFIFDQFDSVPTKTAKLVRVRVDGGQVRMQSLIDI